MRPSPLTMTPASAHQSQASSACVAPLSLLNPHLSGFKHERADCEHPPPDIDVLGHPLETRRPLGTKITLVAHEKRPANHKKARGWTTMTEPARTPLARLCLAKEGCLDGGSMGLSAQSTNSTALLPARYNSPNSHGGKSWVSKRVGINDGANPGHRNTPCYLLLS